MLLAVTLTGWAGRERLIARLAVKRYRLPILVTECWARSWSQCTGSQPAGDLSHPLSGRLPLFPPGLRLPSQPQNIIAFGWYSFYRLKESRRLSRPRPGPQLATSIKTTRARACVCNKSAAIFVNYKNKNWLQFLLIVKAAVLKQQISKI